MLLGLAGARLSLEDRAVRSEEARTMTAKPKEHTRAGTGRKIRELPPMHLEGIAHARPDVVYGLLADLRRHMDWAGERQSPTTRLLTLDAPEGEARVGT